MTDDFGKVLFETMPMGVVFLDASGCVISANPAALSILGASLEKLKAVSVQELEVLCFREDGSRFPWLEQPTMLALRTVTPQGTVLMKVWDQQRQTPRWFSVSATPFSAPDGSLYGVYTIFEEVTERKEAEKRQQEESFSQAMRASDEGFWDWSLSKNQIIYSDRWWQMLGYAQGEMIPEPDLWRSTIHPEDQRRARQLLSEAIEGKTDSFEFGVRLRHKLGHYINAISRVWVRRGPDGKAIGVSGANIDITRRLELEDELRCYQRELQLVNEGLEQRVKERTQALELANRELEAFSYSVSHDLRAPLRHINSFSSILLEDYGEELAPEAHEYLERISSASNRMGTLIDHLLELSRVSRSKLKLEEVNLSGLAVDIIRLLRETDPDRTIDFSAAEGGTVLGDAPLLRQVLENLLGNAWKYTSVKSPACIEFGILTETDEEIFFVRDNGVGFEMQYRERLFRPFERLHGSEIEGLGIGLATAQRIIKRHGGNIWADGAVGEGATFYFTLPAPSESAIPA